MFNINLNDWKIRIVLSTQFAFWGLQIFDFKIFDFHISIIKQVMTFIYITFIPGIAILRILKMHKLGNIETILYSVGMSIATLMFIGFFMNTAYPFMGIYKPISIGYLIITLGLFISILCIISFIINNKVEYDEAEESTKRQIDRSSPTSSIAFTIILLLIFSSSIFGTYLANVYQNNVVLMAMIILIAITAILIIIMNESQKIYYLAIFIMSLSLLYHDSLISSYVTGWDIQSEYYLSSLVTTNSLWNPNIISDVNAMLSIVMLAPIFSNMYNIDLIWVYKIIYPILFSLVPIGLFIIIKKQTNDKVAFLSCFFFISIFTYYSEMISLARQQIAELFLVLMIVVMLDDNIKGINKTIMYTVFGFSLVVSHYGLSYLFLFSLIVIYAIFSRDADIIFSRKFILLYIMFTLTWYIYVAEGSAFVTITTIGSHIKENILELLNPQRVEGINIILRGELSPMRQVTKYLLIITQIFIVIGIFIMTKYNKIYDCMKLKFQFPKKYMNFSYTNIIILFLGVAVPYVASSINTTRLYQIALIFLTPFSIIGGLTLLDFIKINTKKSLTIISIYFSIFLLFNSGFIYEIKNEPSASIPLNYTADYPRFSNAEILTVYWIKEEKEKDAKVYADTYRDLLLSSVTGEHNYFIGDEEITTQPPPGSYIFLGEENIRRGKMVLLSSEYKSNVIDFKRSIFYKKIFDMNKIYDTSYTQILFS